MKIDGVQREAALGRQPARHGRIDAARQQQQGAAGRAHGQAAGRFVFAGEHVSDVGPDLDPDPQRGCVHVDGQPGRGLDGGAHVTIDVQRALREALVGAARFDLERRGSIARDDHARLLDRHCSDRLQIGVRIHLACHRQGHQAEDARQPRGGLVGVVFRQPHQQPTVGLLDAGARQIGQRGAHVVGEHALERAAVPALQEQLAVAAEDDALHGCGVLPERARGVDEGGDRLVGVGRSVVWRENEKRSTAVRSSTPIAFSVGLGPAVRDAQAEPADASTPRASSACSSGSAGRPGNASDAMWGARGAPVTVGRTPGTTPASAVTAVCSK